MIRTAALKGVPSHRPAHPNEFDLKRIERALKARKRYRYVSPSVEKISGGYRITSPCCSRNIDPEGGIIDVALLIYEELQSTWTLLCKDHVKGTWERDSVHVRLPQLLDYLNQDAGRKFWQ